MLLPVRASIFSALHILTKFKYSVKAVGMGYLRHSSPVYFEDFLYDLEKDPIEKNNLIF